ncbi:S24 family peptidase [Lacticaseibacillus saniviri]
MKTTPSNRLRQIMQERNLKQVDILNMSKPFQISLGIKMGKSALSQYVNGKQTPDQDRILLLAKTLGENEAWLLGFDVDRNMHPTADNKLTTDNLTDPENKHITTIRQLTPERQTKVYKFADEQLDEQKDEDNVIDIVTGRATAAGNPINGDDQDGLATMERVSVTDIPHGTDEIVTVDGDSMEPYYPKYSQIFVHWQDTIEDGELAVVHVCDEGVTFKQIYLDDDEKKIILHSLNEKYDDREFDADEIHIIGKVLN